jgi:hypothetical protein
VSDITAVSGDDNRYTLTVVRPGDATFTLAANGTELRFTVKRSRTDTDAEAAISKHVGAGITITGATTAVLALLPADTAGMPDRSYVYDLELTEPDGRITTVAQGKFRVTADVHAGS